MKTLFISDLHLSPQRPELTKLATDFVADQRCDSLYILGDIFNTWLGDDLIPAEFSPFISALQQLTRTGTRLYLMVGNRDFMLGQQFAKLVGGEWLADPTVHEFAGKRVLIMHGDSLCIDDDSYQRYRKVVRNKLLQRCFLALPQRFRQAISDRIKQKSQQQKQFKAAQIMDVNQTEVNRMMQLYQCELLIHGHTHRPAIHTLSTDKQRIVLGDWHDTVSFLQYQDNQFKLIDARLAEQQQTLHC